MVLSAKDIVLDTEPEEGKAAAIAAVVNAIESAGGKALAGAKEAEEATETAEMARGKAEDPMADPNYVGEGVKAKAEKTSEQAEKQANKMARKSSKGGCEIRYCCPGEAEASGVLPEESKKE